VFFVHAGIREIDFVVGTERKLGSNVSSLSEVTRRSTTETWRMALGRVTFDRADDWRWPPGGCSAPDSAKRAPVRRRVSSHRPPTCERGESGETARRNEAPADILANASPSALLWMALRDEPLEQSSTIR